MSLEIRAFSDETKQDAVGVINAYLAGWPYTRMVDDTLIAYWKTLDRFQPENVWVAYRSGQPCAFLHGEVEQGKQVNIHLLAMIPQALEQGLQLLQRIENKAHENGITHLIGPYSRASCFYGGYILGYEPYHPHWAAEATEAYVRAGFRISHPGVLMVMDVRQDIAVGALHPDYDIVEAPDRNEFDARAFGYHALYRGEKVAHCYARLYPNLKTPGDATVGQIGNVATDQAHRRKGLASLMSRMCLKQLQKWGAGEVLVGTGLDSTSAIRTYEKIGFCRRYNINEWSKGL